MKKTISYLNRFWILLLCCTNVFAQNLGDTLPFRIAPSTSIANQTLQKSVLAKKTAANYLPANAPNIVIILLDDIGYGVSDAFGGLIHTPTISALRKEGISYNDFHTTAICSPTRACLLTGRNATRVGNGTIAERAVDFDGYTGIIPKTAATVSEVLKDYGYHTAAFGKWHNTPTTQTTNIGPKNYWPNGYGFEYFYGFMAGETSQYEPRLFENYNAIEPPHDPKYILNIDLVNKALRWVDEEKSFDANKPFFLYMAPGGAHGPHHVFKEWSDKYKGKFDFGWDEYRKKVFANQLKMGVIPSNTLLTPRDSTMASWASIPQSERAFQLRLMEVFAGFVEETDYEMGRFLDGLKQRGLYDNTLVFFVCGDNGSSAEGQQGSISELLAQNGIANTIQQQMDALNKIGGLDALGTPETDNMYHAGWAWAGCTPFKSTKLVAAHFGGTKNPLIISWPAQIKPDNAIRNQFHHVVDIAPTIYDILNIPQPKVVDGLTQIPMDGISLKYTFNQPTAPTKKEVQIFDNNGSRGIYYKGWMASTFGPFIPWVNAQKGIDKWNSDDDVWQLYDLNNDYSQATDLSAKYPEKLNELKAQFLQTAKENNDFPIGAGNWLRIHPEDAQQTEYTSWTFTQETRRMPELTAPGIGKESNKINMDVEIEENQNGVLYAVGGASGGLTCYMEDGYLNYEYNLELIEKYFAKTPQRLSKGKHHLEIITEVKGRRGSAATVTISVDGKQAAVANCLRTVPLAFTASETFDVGVDLGSPVSRAYRNKIPFEFTGKITNMKVELIK